MESKHPWMHRRIKEKEKEMNFYFYELYFKEHKGPYL